MAEYSANLSGVSATTASGEVVGYVASSVTTADGGVSGILALGETVHSVEWGQHTVLSGGGGQQVRSIPRLVRG